MNMKRKEEIENMRKQEFKKKGGDKEDEDKNDSGLVKIDEESKVLCHKEDENRKERE